MGNLQTNDGYIKKPTATGDMDIAALRKSLGEKVNAAIGTAAEAPKPKMPKGPAAPTVYGEASMPKQYSSFLAGKEQLPAKTQIMNSDPAKHREPIPDSYQFDSKRPSDAAYFLNFGDGTGSMVVDPNNREYRYKSSRDFLGDTTTAYSLARQQILGNRSPNLYEIDHILPIWMGGRDDPSNMTVLTKSEHRNKTKAQAVAFTLVANNLISKDEAFSMVTDWERVDRRNLPMPFEPEKNPEENAGMLPLGLAKEKYEQWKNDKAEGRNPNQKKESWWSVMRDPEFAKNYAGNLPDWVPFKNTVQELIKGTTSGASMGWFPYLPDEDAKGVDKVAGLIGNVGGSILSIVALGGAAVAGRAAALAKAASVVKRGTETAAGLGLIGKVAQTTLNTDAAMARFLAPALGKAAKLSTMKKLDFQTTMNMLGAPIIYGQLSPMGVVGKMAGEEDAAPIKNFMENLAFGGTGIFFRPSMKGTAKVVGSTFLMSYFFDAIDGEVDLRQNFVNSLIMGGLHAASSPMMRKNIDKINAAQDELNTRAAHNRFGAILKDGRFSKLKHDEVVPAQGSEKYSTQAIEDARIEAERTILAKTDIDEHTKELLVKDIQVAADQLKRRGLPPSQRERADIEVVDNLLNSFKKDEDVFGLRNSVSKSRYATVIEESVTPDDIKALIPYKVPNTEVPTNQESWITYTEDMVKDVNPVGMSRTTGQGLGEQSQQTTKLYQNSRELLPAIERGEAHDQLIAIAREDLEPVMTKIGATYKDADIAAGTYKPMAHPENVLEVYGVWYKPDGGVELRPVGYMPREFSISEKRLAINKSASPEMYNPSLNKDTVRERMRELGIDFLTLRLDRAKSGPEAQKSKMPWLVYHIDDTSYEQGATLQKFFQNKASVDNEAAKKTIGENIYKARKTRNPKALAEINEVIKNAVPDPADQVLAYAAVDLPIDSGAVETVLLMKKLRGIIETSPDAARLKKEMNKNGIAILDTEAQSLITNKSELTVKNLFDTVDKISNEGRFVGRKGKALNTVYKQRVLPFTKSKEFNGWIMRKTFPSMRIIGRDPSRPAVPGALEKVPGFTDRAPSAKTSVAQPDIQQPAVGVPATPAVPAQPRVIRSKKWNKAQREQEMAKNAPDEVPAGSVNAKQPSKVARAIGKIGARRASKAKPAPVEEQPIPVKQAEPEQVATTNYLDDEPKPKVISEFEAPYIPPSSSKLIAERLKDVEMDMKNIDYNLRRGEGSYKNQLIGLIGKYKIQPGTKLDGRVLSASQVREINQRIDDTVRAQAYNRYNEVVSPAGQVSFATAAGYGDETLVALQKAITEDNFGIKGAVDEAVEGQISNVEAMRQRVGDRIFMDAWKTLHPNKKYVPQKPRVKEFVSKDWEASAERGKAVLDDFVDRPKRDLKEGEPMWEFADFMDNALTAALGERWRDNGLLHRLFDMDSAANGEKGNSIIGSLFASGDTGKTQPVEYLKAAATGSKLGLGKAKKARFDENLDAEMRRADLLDAQNLRKSQLRRGGEENVDVIGEGSLSGEDLGTMTIETSGQRDDLNIPVASGLDTILASITLKNRRGHTLNKVTPENSMADATSLLYKIKSAYDSSAYAYNKNAQRQNKNAELQLVDLVPDKFLFTPDVADKISKARISKLQEAGKTVGDNANSVGVKKTQKEIDALQKQVADDRKRVADNLNKLMIPAYKRLTAATTKKAPTDNKDMIARMIKFKGGLWKRLKDNKQKPTVDESTLLNLVDDMGDVEANIKLAERRIKILEGDLAKAMAARNKKKDSKAVTPESLQTLGKKQ